MNNINGNHKVSSKGGTRLIRLYRDGTTPLGFSIRGGWEHGTGIYVSEVHSGSEAAKQGLQAGDQIIRINGFSLEHAIHDDVIALVKSSAKVTLKIKSVGMIPIRDRLTDVLTWKLLTSGTGGGIGGGHSLTSSLDSGSPSPPWTTTSPSDSHSDSEGHDYLEANVYIDLKGKSLGCSVVKGPPNSPGIFVQSVKSGEIAAQSGLEVGDQIIAVNGVDVLHMEFSDAITKLKSLPAMTLMVRKGAGKGLFTNGTGSGNGTSICSNNNHHINNNNDFNNKLNNNYVQNKKKVTAIVHQHPVLNGNPGNGHTRMLSTGSSNGSHRSSSISTCSSAPGVGLVGNGKSANNTIISDNDYSLSEMEANCVETTVHSMANSLSNSKMNSINGNNNCVEMDVSSTESPLKILEKVKQQEERLADERRKLELEQQKLKLELQKLELEKKELEKRKQYDECHSLSNCSISSVSNSSSGSQSIGFLDEIKAMGEHNKRMLRPVNSTDTNGKGSTNGPQMNGKVIPNNRLVANKGDNNKDDKHKQHELLMEEFRRAHRRMFGDTDRATGADDSQSCHTTPSESSAPKVSPNPTNPMTVKETIKESKSLPIANTGAKTTGATPQPPALTNGGTTATAPVVKTPPAVPVKRTSTGPVVQIGTYANTTYNANRFIAQTHRSVIHVRSDDSTHECVNRERDVVSGNGGDNTLCSNSSSNPSVDTTNTNASQITIKVISTKQ